MGFFKQLKEAWLASVTFDKLDDEFYDQLEEALILADVGVDSATDAVAKHRLDMFWMIRLFPLC